MDVSRKALIATFIINLFLIALAVACIFVTKYNIVVLWLSVAMIALVLVSSVLIWVYGRGYRK